MQSDRVRRLTKEGSWIVIGQVAAIAGTLALVRVLTEYLSPAEYGNLALALTLSALMSQVVMGGIGGGISRYYSIALERGDLRGYFQDSRQLVVYGTLGVLAIASLVVIGLMFLGFRHVVGLTIAAIFLSVLRSYNTTVSGIQNAARQRTLVAFHAGLSSWLNVAMALFAVHLLGVTSTAVIIGYITAAAIVTCSQLYFLRPLTRQAKTNTGSRQPWGRQMWQHSWPFSAWGVFTWTQQVSDRWSLEAYSDPESVGLYIVVFQLGYTPISLALGLATSFLGPIIFQRSGDVTDELRNKGVHDLSWKLTGFSLLITIVAFTTTWFLHDLLFRILVAVEYRKASYLLPWVILAGGLFASGQMLSLKLISELKTVRLLAPKITTAILGVLFNIIGAAYAGIHGVVAALIAFSVVYLLWMVVLSQHTNTPTLEDDGSKLTNTEL
jgi:O-antigen/teichoic acid export membrane protein